MKNRIVLLTVVVCQNFVLLPVFGQEAISEQERERLYNERVAADAKAAEVEMIFWGKVVDQHGQPVVDANITVYVQYFDPVKLCGERFQTLTTDANGEFKLKTVGLEIGIKDIYKYLYEYNRQSNPRTWFVYSRAATRAEDYYTPSPDKPFVFYLRKKGEPAFLYNQWRGSMVFHQKESKDVKIELLHSWCDPNGNAHPLEKNAIPYVVIKGRPTADINEYSLEFTIPDVNSGVLLSDTLLYEAPKDGYQSSLVQMIQLAKPDKTINTIKRYLYVKGKEGKYYSRVNMEYTIDEDRFSMQYDVFTNPELRNLEYDDRFQSVERERRRQKSKELYQERMRKINAAQSHEATN